MIQRESKINPLDESSGVTLENVTGTICFENVDFNYANRTALEENDRPNVLRDFNLRIHTGKSHALVGPSGCGKSTIVRLIERLYDVQSGAVLLDGVDVRDLNARWLRSQIGYVGQMPTLFMLSIRENIALGAPMELAVDKKGKSVMKRRVVTDAQIIEAAKMANAHEFIMNLPEEYNTVLGERGALLSGGQKQRICIARALIRDPKILLLDESTSNLDAESERHVQHALEKASTGRTTIIIAHRLSTVKNCDVISVLGHGNITEQGTHDELMQVGGTYKSLVKYQDIQMRKVGEVQGKSATGPAEGNRRYNLPSESSPAKIGNEDNKKSNELPSVDKGVIKRAFKLNAREYLPIFMGMIGGALNGAAFPVMAISFSRVSLHFSSQFMKFSLLSQLPILG